MFTNTNYCGIKYYKNNLCEFGPKLRSLFHKSMSKSVICKDFANRKDCFHKIFFLKNVQTQWALHLKNVTKTQT